MNFISDKEGREIQLELKYCERCGGLWLRPQGADDVYCTSCHALMVMARPDPAKTPSLRQTRREKAQAKRTNLQLEEPHGEARIDYLEGVAAMEVWA